MLSHNYYCNFELVKTLDLLNKLKAFLNLLPATSSVPKRPGHICVVQYPLLRLHLKLNNNQIFF